MTELRHDEVEVAFQARLPFLYLNSPSWDEALVNKGTAFLKLFPASWIGAVFLFDSIIIGNDVHINEQKLIL